MKPTVSLSILAAATIVLVCTPSMRAVPAVQPGGDAGRVLGRWYSTERFEGEARISLGFRQGARSIEGWAVLLGQHRKKDNRATLALSFSEASWNGQSLRFSTILPEDEGTIGWELRVETPATAVLAALTEDGEPIQDELKWDMTR